MFKKQYRNSYNKKNKNKNKKYKNEYKINHIKTIEKVLIIISFIFFSIINNKSFRRRNNGDTIKEFQKLLNSSFNNGDSKINSKCLKYDPINIFEKRLKTEPFIICQNNQSTHICYKENENLIAIKNGLVCKMENIIIDPSKSKDSGFIYNGPFDKNHSGNPILSHGFFNMKCANNKTIENYNENYITYINSWDYEYKDNMEGVEELAPGKIVFFMSRSQDSPNLFHGTSDLVNAISIMNIFNINPEDIQIVFLESLIIIDDPMYDLYENIVSRGGKPIYIRNLKKKYHISKAIHIPMNFDSPCFIFFGPINCEFPTKTYKFLNFLVDKYMDIKSYEDKFISDNITFYYPKITIESYKSNIKFKKAITFIWRKVWPRNRPKQSRLVGNGPELVEKLSSVIPKDYLIRLVDTSSLSISEQISIIKSSDYVVGIHGAGFSLSIYAKYDCIIHEIWNQMYNHLLMRMSSLSGHKAYFDIITAKVDNKDHEYIYLQEDEFVNCVLKRMKENNFI